MGKKGQNHQLPETKRPVSRAARETRGARGTTKAGQTGSAEARGGRAGGRRRADRSLRGRGRQAGAEAQGPLLERQAEGGGAAPRSATQRAGLTEGAALKTRLQGAGGPARGQEGASQGDTLAAGDSCFLGDSLVGGGARQPGAKPHAAARLRGRDSGALPSTRASASTRKPRAKRSAGAPQDAGRPAWVAGQDTSARRLPAAGPGATRAQKGRGAGAGAPLSDLDQHVADVHVAGLRRGVQRGALVLVLHLEVGVDSVNCGRTGFSDYSRASH